MTSFNSLFACRFTQYQRMLGTLAQCEFSMGKTLMVYDMNLREMENYEKIYSNIGEVLFPSFGLNSVYSLRFYLNTFLPLLQNKTSHLHMRRLQNAKKIFSGPRGYEKIAKARIFWCLNMHWTLSVFYLFSFFFF